MNRLEANMSCHEAVKTRYEAVTDLEKINSMNSVEFNFFKDFLPNLLFFLPNLDP